MKNEEFAAAYQFFPNLIRIYYVAVANPSFIISHSSFLWHVLQRLLQQLPEGGHSLDKGTLSSGVW